MRSTAVLLTRLRINDSEGFSVGGFAGESPAIQCPSISIGHHLLITNVRLQTQNNPISCMPEATRFPRNSKRFRGFPTRFGANEDTSKAPRGRGTRRRCEDDWMLSTYTEQRPQRAVEPISRIDPQGARYQEQHDGCRCDRLPRPMGIPQVSHGQAAPRTGGGQPHIGGLAKRNSKQVEHPNADKPDERSDYHTGHERACGRSRPTPTRAPQEQDEHGDTGEDEEGHNDRTVNNVGLPKIDQTAHSHLPRYNLGNSEDTNAPSEQVIGHPPNLVACSPAGSLQARIILFFVEGLSR